MSSDYTPLPPSSSEVRWPPADYDRLPTGPPWAAQRFRHRYWVHALLLLATIATTTLVGGLHYVAFLSDFGARQVPLSWHLFLPHGFWYSGTLLLILGAHEMGHYLACRHHRVDATLPYFLPAPIPLTGTIGAFIRIREAFPDRRILFDIGVAGPLAGFAVLVPALFLGLTLSNVAPLPDRFEGFALGEPLLFQLAAQAVWGPLAEGYSLNMHPMVFASWFGLFATALNLMPFGQLDGGHIAYAALGRRSTLVSLLTVAIALALTFVSSSWMMITILMLVMLIAFGPRHPSVLDETVNLDSRRLTIAFIAAVVFILCFTPVPIEPLDLLG